MRKVSAAAVTVLVIGLGAISVSGTAVAAVIISKNGQVAAHTIAGAQAPNGDKQNIITGSLGTSDLHTGAVTGSKLGADAVTGSKVKNGSLTGADLATGSVGPGKLALPGFSAAVPNTSGVPTFVPMLTVGDLTVGLSCYTGSSDTAGEFKLKTTATGATVRGFDVGGTGNSPPSTSLENVSLAANTVTAIGTAPASESGAPHVTGVLIYTDGTRAMTINYDFLANASTHTCQVSGTVLPGSA